MADLELLRRLSAAGDLTEAELDGVRGFREEQDAFEEMFESRRDEPAGAKLSDEAVVALASEEAMVFIIQHEISSEKTYKRKYMQPLWPGGASGVTIGIGYDLGHQKVEDFKRHWQGLLEDAEIAELAKACGLKGESARVRCPELAHISVAWDVALAAHRRSVVPGYCRLVLKTFPNALDLPGHGFGALLSLVFNRGARLKDNKPGDRTEMRGIREHMAKRDFAAVPDEFRRMKRLWEGTTLTGLIKRREAEAILFERGLEVATWSASIAGPGESLESVGGRRGPAADNGTASPPSLDSLHYEIGLLSETARRHGNRLDGAALESLADAQLEMSLGDMKAIGRTIALDLERKLQAYVCGANTVSQVAGALVEQQAIKSQIDDAAKAGRAALKTCLVTVLQSVTVIVPGPIIEAVVEVILTKLVEPAVGPVGSLVQGRLVGSAQWLCAAWSERLAQQAGRAAEKPVAQAQGLAPLMRAMADIPEAPKPKRATGLQPPQVIPDTPATAAAKRIAKALSGLKAAAQGANPDVPGVKTMLDEIRKVIESGESGLDPQQAAELLDALVNSRTLDHTAGAPDPYLPIAEIEKALRARPLDHIALRKSVDDLHGLLGDARMRLDPGRAKAMLQKLRSNRQFDDLARLADRMLTRDPSLLSKIGTLYAQGLIDGGRIFAGIAFLNSLIERGELDENELGEAHGLVGRAHKQIYVNHVRSGSDAMALKDSMAPQLQRAVEGYRKAWDPAQPAEKSWQGINYAALLHRAAEDHLPANGHEPARAVAQQMIPALEAQLAASKDPWLLATIAEAHLVAGNTGKAAEYYGKYAQQPGIDAFALAGSIRQLEEVYRLRAGPTGAGAILMGLKSALAAKDGSVLRLSAEERRALQSADGAQYQACFESAIAGGKYINFGLLKLIVDCGSAVAAIQQPMGRTGQTVGTGFLLHGPDLNPHLEASKSYVLTNAHVVFDPRLGSDLSHALTPEVAQIVFENEQIDGRASVYRIARVIWQSPSQDLDACLVELDRRVEMAKPLTIAAPDSVLMPDPDGSGRGTRLAVLGHPKGGSLSLSVLGSLEEMKGTLVDRGGKGGKPAPEFLHYWTPTEPGNSGSPVFDAQSWRVVGLHHAGFTEGRGRERLGGKPGVNMANEGIYIHSIREALAAHLKPAPAAKKAWRWKGGG